MQQEPHIYFIYMKVIKLPFACSELSMHAQNQRQTGSFIRTKFGFHARIQEFSSGGSRPVWQKSSDNVFFFFLFFFWGGGGGLSSAYFKEVLWSISKKSIIFQGSRGVQHFPGGGGVQLFPGGGVQLLIPYRNPYNLWFSRGGVRTPCPPSGSALVFFCTTCHSPLHVF